MKMLKPNVLEKKIQNSFISTGIIDMIFGIFFVSIGLISGINQLIKIAIIFGIILLYNYIKTKVIEPRIGIYKFSIKRCKTIKFQNTIIASLTLVFVVLIILANTGLVVIDPIILNYSIGMIIIIIAVIMSKIFNFQRLIIYGLLLSTIILFTNYLIESLGEFLAISIMFIIPGVIIFSFGLYLFIRFIKNNPIIERDQYE